jgi:DNA-binding transcriptional ArsR family regulator
LSRARDPFAAVADATRRAILDLLRIEGDLPAGAIATRFPSISRVAVSKHLKVLREARLVKTRRHGREIWYHLDALPLREIEEDWLARFAPLWEASLDALREAVETPVEACEPGGPTSAAEEAEGGEEARHGPEQQEDDREEDDEGTVEGDRAHEEQVDR